jgi:hypothetical protein
MGRRNACEGSVTREMKIINLKNREKKKRKERRKENN